MDLALLEGCLRLPFKIPSLDQPSSHFAAFFTPARTTDIIDRYGKLHAGGFPDNGDINNSLIIKIVRVSRVVADFGSSVA